MLPNALGSALGQDFRDFEIVVVDDASTDDVPDVIRRYTEPRIRAYRNEVNVGLYANHNICLQYARAEWVVFLHTDDVLDRNALSIFGAYLRTNADVAVWFPAKEMHRGHVVAEPVLLSGTQGAARLCRWPAAAPTGALLRKRTIDRFDETTPAADLKAYFRILLNGGTVALIPEQTVHIGEGAHQYTHRWLRTGQFTRDVAAVFGELRGHTALEECLKSDFPSWSTSEQARFLMFLSHAGNRELISQLERRVENRDALSADRRYAHVKLYKILGTHGLSLMFRLAKMWRAVEHFVGTQTK